MPLYFMLRYHPPRKVEVLFNRQKVFHGTRICQILLKPMSVPFDGQCVVKFQMTLFLGSVVLKCVLVSINVRLF